MARNKVNKAWMARHVRDPYVRQAAAQGYRSRAAFKLLELDARDRLLRPGMTVLDLGAAPGGWSQVAAERTGKAGRVVAVDLLPMAPLAAVSFVRADLRDPAAWEQLAAALAGHAVDLVLSDMAPNLTGVAATDTARSQELVEIAIAAAQRLLKPQGAAVVKLFHGSGLDAVIASMRKIFQTVAIRKPPASRSRSSEIYAVGRGLLPR